MHGVMEGEKAREKENNKKSKIVKKKGREEHKGKACEVKGVGED